VLAGISTARNIAGILTALREAITGRRWMPPIPRSP